MGTLVLPLFETLCFERFRHMSIINYYALDVLSLLNYVRPEIKCLEKFMTNTIRCFFKVSKEK